jgi:hypothetical protein
MRAVLPRGLLALCAALLPVVLAACQPGPSTNDVELLDGRVTIGPERSCGDLGFSDTRCTLLTLRAARHLEEAHPDATIAERELHEAGPAPAGASPIPSSQEAVAVFVFTLDDGSRVGVPILCPTGGSTSDQACNPLLQ